MSDEYMTLAQAAQYERVLAKLAGALIEAMHTMGDNYLTKSVEYHPDGSVRKQENYWQSVLSPDAFLGGFSYLAKELEATIAATCEAKLRAGEVAGREGLSHVLSVKDDCDAIASIRTILEKYGKTGSVEIEGLGEAYRFNCRGQQVRFHYPIDYIEEKLIPGERISDCLNIIGGDETSKLLEAFEQSGLVKVAHRRDMPGETNYMRWVAEKEEELL